MIFSSLSNIWSYLLFLCFVSFGFSLFIVESPYFDPIRKFVKKKNWTIFLKGLQCYTCTGFWGGLIFSGFYWGYFITDFRLSIFQKIALVFFGACAGCGFSTACSYLMDWYLIHRKKYAK